MSGTRKWMTIAAAIATFAAFSPIVSRAADFPVRPVHMVVPYAPGGFADVLGRMLGEKAQKSLGQPVLIENKPGASTALGLDYTAAQAPDGYTVAIISNSVSLLALTNKDFKRDPVRDFTHISQLISGPYVFTVSSAVPAKNMSEFIAYAKQNPGKLNFGSSGMTDHLAYELFKQMAGVDIAVIPYKGGGPAVTAVLANEIQMILQPLGTVSPHLAGGKVRALGITTAQPSILMPGTPTVASTVPGYDPGFWLGLSGPAGMSRDMVQTLNRVFVAGLKEADVSAKVIAGGNEVIGSTPEFMTNLVRKEGPLWMDVAKKGGLGG